MKYLLEIAYDGTNYKGWQIQKNEKTIQSTLEDKLNVVLRSVTKLYVAGRTDAGVHAEMQCAHFESSKELKESKLQYSLNSLLKGESIIIKSIKKVEDNFHARFSCKMKEYQYHLLIGHVHNIFLNNRYWLVPKFNLDLAQKCAQLIEGNHDFSSFRDSQCQATSPIRTIHSCKFEQKNELITMRIQAKSFLHHQIRIIMGTIFEIISKNEDERKILTILRGKNRSAAGPTAPARGLFLSKIEY